ncbi:flavodoxin [Thomasclavelia spiroformis]|uniref:Flavodoxin n=2 Tax=Thomasclavelia spiroformis TaxID=29348 RepID=A0A1Y4QHB8_9FIRM|nr:flavodoxin [Thomasclavelia spiroformis]
MRGENIMKKVITLIMSLFLVLGLSGCSNNSQDESSNSSTNENKTENTNTTTTDSKTLVVYYSATGNTEEAANLIAQETNGDLFELEPVEPYSDDDLNWSDENSRVVYEHDHEDARNVELVSTTVENWDEYDRVFIGYPLWWQIAAWPVNSFVENNDFTGKTVIPFCTSSSDGIGESGQLLADMAGTGNWLEGRRFSSSVSQDDIQEWIASLN